VAPDVLAHRLILNAKARFNEAGAHDVVAEILEQTPMPALEVFSG
jgi:MoxR-like ATPase